MHPNDQEKTAFVIEWGVFVAVVMMFSLKTVTATFQRVIQEIFAVYIPHLCKSSWMILPFIVGNPNILSFYDYS